MELFFPQSIFYPAFPSIHPFTYSSIQCPTFCTKKEQLAIYCINFLLFCANHKTGLGQVGQGVLYHPGTNKEQLYFLPVFANALDPEGDFIDVTMCPKIVKKILVRLSQSIPVNHKYILCLNATAVDQTGTKVNVTMYAKTWEDVVIGLTYICHHQQIALCRYKGPQLRTIPETALKRTLLF